ncbi:uncharacterized protein LOC122638680 [Telopea speciosissima]|uniref:uncharacterized protein LOC122638680 n=1 Tax=Telopea speciosissima TaxID=54955 RepID=UPI001CC38B0C|nr:uncharacterized protein LOC122638680 [Telopea speciosissima]
MPMHDVAGLVDTIMEIQQQQMQQLMTTMGDQFQAVIRTLQTPQAAPAKEIELAELTQGPKSVLEYQQKFVELFFFAPPHLNNDEAKAQKFEDGLRPQIASIMPTRTNQGYSETVQLAKRVEDKQRDAYHVSQGSGKRAAPFINRGFIKFTKSSGPSSALALSQRNESESSVSRPVYANPSTKATDAAAPASTADFKCYTCGQTGHTSRTCFHRRHVLPVRQPASKPQGRVYSVTASEAEVNQAVVTAYTLFDTGVTHSFVSPSFAKRTSVSPKCLTEGLAVSTPTGSRIDLNTVYEPCAMKIADRDMNAHLIQLNMIDFDVILGMDWLALYKVKVLCAKKKIVFQARSEKGFIFVGDQKKRPRKMLISALKMKKLLDKGC